jgi:hypothetical protein
LHGENAGRFPWRGRLDTMNGTGREEPVAVDANRVRGVVFFPNTPVIPWWIRAGEDPRDVVAVNLVRA